MGLRSALTQLGPPRRCVADLAAPIQLAPAAQQSKIKSAHQPPRSCRGQPVEAPHLAIQARRVEVGARTPDWIERAGALALESIELARSGNRPTEADVVE